MSQPKVLEAALAPSRARQLVRAGDILVSTVRPNLNAVAEVSEALDGSVVSTGYCVLRPDQSKVSSRYLFHWVTSARFVDEMVRLATGASYPAVSDSIVKSSPIPLPSLPEQRRIAAMLDKADELRAKRRAAIALLDQLTQAIFLETFGDLDTNSKGWRSPVLAEFARVQIGPFGSLLHQHDYVEGGVPIVNPKHIQGGRIETSARETVSASKYEELTSYRLEASDVVMGRRGEMGRCAVVARESLPLLCGTGSLFIRPDEAQVIDLYLLHVLSSESVKRSLEHASVGQTLPNLNARIVEQLNVPLPPLELQRQFASRIEAIHCAKAANQSALIELDTLFASLQDNAFQGDSA